MMIHPENWKNVTKKAASHKATPKNLIDCITQIAKLEMVVHNKRHIDRKTKINSDIDFRYYLV